MKIGKTVKTGGKKRHEERKDMSRKLVLALIVALCVLVGACSREQTQRAAGSQSAASEEQQKLKQQLAEQQKKLDEQHKKLDEQQQRLAEQQKAEGAPSPGQSSPGQSAGNEAASQAGSAAATASKAPAEPAAPPKPSEPVYVTLRLEPGTPVVVRTTTEVSTKAAKPGDTFVATLEEPLSDDDNVTAGRGAEVAGRIVASDPGGRAKGKAKISVELVSLTTASGKKIPISTVALTQEAGSTAKKDLKRTGIATGVGTAVGALAGGGKGAAIGAGVGAGAARGK